MRFSALLLGGLALLAGVDADPARIKCCNPCKWGLTTQPLIPADSYVSATHENLLVELVNGIAEDLDTIERRVKRGRLRKSFGRSRKQWEMMATCIPTIQHVGQENYVNVRFPLLLHARTHPLLLSRDRKK